MKTYYVYIMTNERNTVLYTGVSSDLERRVFQHKSRMAAGFTRKYNVHKLVYFESANNPIEAITREKVIKGWKRERKIDLIERINSKWEDISSSF